MTNGPIKRSNQPINPYPKGSARYKLWERREADRRKKEAAEEKPKKKTKEDKSERRKYLDEQIEG